MAVIYYGPGDHPKGFNGFRVYTTVDRNRFDEYFPLSRYSYSEAKKLAHQCNDKMREMAEDCKLIRRIYGDRKDFQIAIGLYCCLKREVHHLRSGNGKTIDYIPCFCVSIGKGKNRHYRINVEGYDKAYRLAVDHYCQHHRLSNSVKTVLMKRKPDKSLFTSLLFNNKYKKFKDVSKDRIGRLLA